MAGISDLPYRLLCRRMGAGFAFTEFVNAELLAARRPSAVELLRFHEAERPILFQIYGADFSTLLEAGRVARDLGADVVDVNMGCSCSRIAQRGAGAGMLRDPKAAGRVVEALARDLDVPVTAKIRLGWEKRSRNYLEVAHVLEESGASLLSVHGRTRDQAYAGTADWGAIGEIKARARIPVLGNGDIATVEDARFRMQETGVDGVLVGRGAIGNPWIFAGRDRSELLPTEVIGTAREHLAMMDDYHYNGAVLFRKHAARYLVGFEGAVELRARAIRAQSARELDELFASFIREGVACLSEEGTGGSHVAA